MQSNFLKILRGKPIASLSDALALIPTTAAQAHEMVRQALVDIAALKTAILSLSPERRTYANTVAAYDEMEGLVFVVSFAVTVLKQVSSDVARRAEPYRLIHEEAIKICKDAAIYQAFCEYRDYGMVHEVLTTEQGYFFKKIMADFKRCGYDKDPAALARIVALEKELQAYCNAFDATLNNDATTLVFPESALSGVSSEFLASQARDADGNVVLYCNRSTLNALLQHCTNPVVRRAFKKAHDSRAYPENEGNLKKMLEVRSELAQLLGYETYASYALAGYMAGSPDTVRDYLGDVFERIEEAAARDFKNLMSTLPQDVELSPEGKVHPWDIPYAIATYEKINSSLDSREVAQYFPVDRVIRGVFSIYEKFLGISLAYTQTVPGAWHESVQAVTVYTKDRSRVLAYILMDLYPRPQKYAHACCVEVVPRVHRHNTETGMLYEVPSVSVIVANFPKAAQGMPALFLHSDVITFFHEFGHAMHNALSCTSHFKTSGSMGVMLDFIELPSQIMEEWMWRPEVLRSISGHYKTGKPLPEGLIQKLVAARRSGRSYFDMNQIYYSMFALTAHEAQAPIDLDTLLRESFMRYMRGMAWDADNKFYASFGHLPLYGPCYYGYSYSRSFAFDVFARIESHGLFDESIGREFVEKILKPGGSAHPRDLLANFLGRPATSGAYIEWISAVRDEEKA